MAESEWLELAQVVDIGRRVDVGRTVCYIVPVGPEGALRFPIPGRSVAIRSKDGRLS